MNELTTDIYNSLGQLVLSKQANAGENQIQINNLSKGVYYVTVYCNGIKTSTQKLLIVE